MYAMGKAIRWVRDLNGIEQAALAEKVGIHPSLLCHIERGRRKCQPDLLNRLAEAMGVPSADIETIERRITNEIRTGVAN